MPRKYEGEAERDPKKVAAEKVAEAAIGAGLAGALGGVGRAPKLIGEIRKQRGKVRGFDPPAQKSGLLRNTLRKPIDPSAPKKKRTFTYKPWT